MLYDSILFEILAHQLFLEKEETEIIQ